MIKKICKNLILTFLVVTFMALVGPIYVSAEEIVPQGVTIEGIDVSGKTKEEAQALVDEYVANICAANLNLVHGETIIDIPLNELGIGLADDSVVNHAVHIGTSGNVVARYKETTDAKTKGVNLTLNFTCDDSLVRQALESRLDVINSTPADATLARIDGQFVITDAQIGRTLRIDEMIGSIKENIEHQWDRQMLAVAMIVDEQQPAHTREELQVIGDKLGSYSTSFAGSSANRIQNIQVGTQKMDNTVLYPGEEFSFLSKTVPFTADNGYTMAGTYSAGKSVDGMGGGICQVSSTLYNAVLRAELTIVSRRNHMMTVGYVPLGADATIANPSTDFIFRNDGQYPVFLEIFTDGNSVYANIYGVETRPANRTIEFVSVTEQTINPGADVVTYDPTKPSSYVSVTQGAHTGYVVAFYKNVYVDGQLETQELINRSNYGAYPRYVVQGAAAEPAETAAPVETVAPVEEAPVEAVTP